MVGSNGPSSSERALCHRSTGKPSYPDLTTLLVIRPADGGVACGYSTSPRYAWRISGLASRFRAVSARTICPVWRT